MKKIKISNIRKTPSSIGGDTLGIDDTANIGLMNGMVSQSITGDSLQTHIRIAFSRAQPGSGNMRILAIGSEIYILTTWFTGVTPLTKVSCKNMRTGEIVDLEVFYESGNKLNILFPLSGYQDIHFFNITKSLNGPFSISRYTKNG